MIDTAAIEQDVPIEAPPVVYRMEYGDLDRLISLLAGQGFRVIGPTVRDEAIVYDEIDSAARLPAGWTDEQEAGHYRLRRRDDNALFGYAVGPRSLKTYLLPPSVRLWKARKTDGSFVLEDEPVEPPRLAVLGVRACEVHAMLVQDRVFLNGPYVDPFYQAQRERLFLVAVQCGSPAATCFCTSMGTGPRAGGGVDLALTEVVEGGYFVAEARSEAGEKVLEGLDLMPAHDDDRREAEAILDRAEAAMGRQVNTDGIKDLLTGSFDSPRWDEIATRCLSCANCTAVCPTCFCTTVEDHTDLAGAEAERVRTWDSCFSVDYSYIHGGSVRPSPKARYRQWMTHKFGTWIDQFGTSGCVGCGRCVTWCPAAIDITAELAALRADSAAQPLTSENSTTQDGHGVVPVGNGREGQSAVAPLKGATTSGPVSGDGTGSNGDRRGTEALGHASSGAGEDERDRVESRLEVTDGVS